MRNADNFSGVTLL